MAKNKKKTKRITQGGYESEGLRIVRGQDRHAPDVILQMPMIFNQSLLSLQRAATSALSIDSHSRSALYDIYQSSDLDLHFKGVLEKRLEGATRIPIEFHRNGKADDIITPQLKSPWFNEVLEEIVLAKFWGFSIMQFYLDAEGNIRADQIDRKHYNPMRRELLQFSTDHKGVPIEDFDNILFIGKERDLGALFDISVALLYKRGNLSDWARFCNIFGIPIRMYTYDAGDEETRKELIKNARTQGTEAVYICPKESNLDIIEPKNASANGDLFERFTRYWDSEISVRVLGNTLTTDAQSTGTQALGTIHKEIEDQKGEQDRKSILFALNYYMKPIFSNLGFNVEGGEFVAVKKDKMHPTQQADVVLKMHSIGLPISDDYLYEFSGIPKPDNYEQMIAEKKAEKKALQDLTQTPEESEEEEEEPSKKDDKVKGNNPPKPKNKLSSLRSFFGLAPKGMGASDF